MKILNKIKKGLKTAFSTLEGAVNPLTKIVVALIVIVSAMILGNYLFQDKSDITTSTVMITTMNGRSGGTGVIVGTHGDFSYILTNRHVCKVGAQGGLVTTTTGQSHTILEYRESLVHDLCMITVASKLPGKVTLASSAPKMYEKATVSGHPALLPNVLTEGHFSGYRVIDVFMGMRKCTDKELDDEKTAGICFFFKGMPSIQTFESVLVTATIMPGSSGSAIYNSSKELGALVFAGSGEIGYAFAVPYEYVAYFLTYEAPRLPANRPNYLFSASGGEDDSHKKNTEEVVEKCKKDVDSISDVAQKSQIEYVCGLIVRDSKWRLE
jgi:S1-C subfamily serine protease